MKVLLRLVPGFILAILLVVGLLVVRDWWQELTLAGEDIPATVLRDDETIKLHVNDRRVTVATKKGVSGTYVPSSGHATVTVKKDGSTDVAVKKAGMSWQLGGGIVYADRLRLGVDFQFAYWNRFGGHVGIAFADKPVAIPFVGVSYRLDQLRLSNTSLLVGITPRKEWIGGIRWEF